ncbi:MAG: flagellar biosynthesis anti-sigma factor FlgM [Gammaproteobacteria bacterium]|nr:flagellar biosynthesis anti-sigma factor FlgM [Gammaproteobacteria bacterium]
MTNKIGPVDQSMVGKIGGKVDESDASNRVSPEQGTQGSDAGRSGASSDTVKLTSGAQLLERLEKSLESLPAVDSKRVAEIRSAIENGNYEVNAQAIADALIRFERSFGE